MTLLERLKYLNAEGRLRKPGEDLAHWADRDKEENLWVRDIALPLLLELVEAVKAYVEADGIASVHLYCAMEDVLAKLEVEQEGGGGVMVRPFSNGVEYRYWLATNCEGCRKYQPENVMGKGCPIEEALYSASVMDGEISEAIWKRMGKDSGNCTKFKAVEGGSDDDAVGEAERVERTGNAGGVGCQPYGQPRPHKKALGT